MATSKSALAAAGAADNSINPADGVAPPLAPVPHRAPGDEDYLWVQDGSAHALYDGSDVKHKRRHEVTVNGQVIVHDFIHGGWTKMPRAQGLKFLKPAGFIVRDHAGRVLRAVHDPLSVDPGAQAKLAHDEVVANLRELMLPALVARANVIDGGEKFGGNSSREEVIGFLAEARRKLLPSGPKAPVRDAPIEAEIEDGDGVGGDAFEQQFGKVDA